jgi:predicted DNA binding protein
MANSHRRLAALRSSDEEAAENRVLIATLRIGMQKDLWTGGFSRAHPSLRLEGLNRTDLTSDISVSDYWISGGSPGLWASEISGYSDVQRVESLAEVADGCIYRVTYRNPPVVDLYRRLRLPLQFPLRIQSGIITWEVVARRAEFDEVLRYIKDQHLDATIVSIRRRPLRSHLPSLTQGQQQLLSDAMAAGYFAVPRGITLTDLAKRLGRSKSSISESLAHIEKKLLESALQPSTLAT